MILALTGFAVTLIRDENIDMYQRGNGYCESVNAGLSNGSQHREYRR